jgi:hypothetical protein
MNVKRNVIGGLIITCIGGIFLAISADNLVAAGSYANDIEQEFCDYNGCRPLEQIAMDAAIGSGIFGTALTSAGLFFFIYGMKRQQTPKQPAKRAE